MLIIFSGQSHSKEVQVLTDQSVRPKIGLVLSGGGARGAAHVGVLKVLEEHRIPIDAIAGTSFGAIVGGLSAAGYTADQLEHILESIDWQVSLSGSAPRDERSFKRKQDDDGLLIKFKVGIEDGRFKLPRGLITANNLRLTLQDLIVEVTDVGDFDELKIPFRAVATDLETGEEVVLDHGNLASAIVASMAVPALFPPAEFEGRLLVDGGVSNNVPVDVVRSMGVDLVIVVDISTPLINRDDIGSFKTVFDQLITIMTNRNSAAQLATLSYRDILIRPILDDIDFVDFENAREIIPRGIEAATAALPRLADLGLSQQAWVAYMESRREVKREQPQIDFIQIVNNSRISDDVIRAHLSLQVDQPLDELKLSEELSEIYGMEIFEEVSYELVERDNETGVEIVAKRNQIGHQFLRFGLALKDDFDGESDFQISTAFTNLAINSLGGEIDTRVSIGDEFSLFAEYYQPVDYTNQYYLFFNGFRGKFNRNIVESNGKIAAQTRISQTTVHAGLGTNFGNWGTLRFGALRSKGNVDVRIGFPTDESTPFDDTAFTALFAVDSLDEARFPHSGTGFAASYTNSQSSQNGNSLVDAFTLNGYQPFSWGRNTLGLVYQYVTTMNSGPEELNLFELGGFPRMAAYAPGQLTGNYGGTAGLMYYRRIGGLRLLTQTPIYFGGLIEAGNLWNKESDMSLSGLHNSSSLFFGADSFLGPVYLGFAIGDDNQTAAFLYVGQLF
ncbi:patatin-like phospholipase family protein [Haliea sp.]